MAASLPPTSDLERARIGETLRAIRTARGVRVGELAKLVDRSSSYLSNIEAGRKPLTPALTARIAQVLDIKPIALVRPDYFDADGRAS